MAYDFRNIPSAYRLVFQEHLEDQDAQAGLLIHKKTGARVAVVSNSDENKVFNIGFRTPPAKGTGIAHIMEHSVLCGSEKYPVKDPFVELLKGSLNTFLNAMTYPDKTVYPLASCNTVDFCNLMDIYLDAVFHPAIYIHPEIFRQEGWHYELKDKKGPLLYNGVVYNEMKGNYSSPESVLDERIMESLYPDTPYSVDSGGDPDLIPELTYEEFLDFHKKYYHPSNSYIYLYGDLDVEERLTYIDEQYLSKYDRRDIDSSIPLQKAFTEPVQIVRDYPVGSDDSEENASYLALNWVSGSSTDALYCTAMDILEYILMEAPGAPVKQALLKAGFGTDVYGSFENDLQQPYFSIVVKNMDPQKLPEVQELVRKKLEELADGGIDRRSLEGALRTYDFRAREADFGRFPKGLMYGLNMMESWLYDESKPFEYMKQRQMLGTLKEKLQDGYFEELIRRALLDNPHASAVLLNPRQGLTAERENALAEKMQTLLDSLSEDEKQQLVEDTAALQEYQSQPSPREDLDRIPLLKISDIRREILPIRNQQIKGENCRALFHDYNTHGIAYVNLLFNVSHIPAEDIPYLGILSEVLANVDTDDYSYAELTDEINMNTGGIHASVTAYSRGNTHEYIPVFALSGKAVYERLPQMADLMRQIIMDSHYADSARLKDILNQSRSRQQMSLISSGHAAAAARAASYYSECAWFKELTGGIAYYQFVNDLVEHFDDRKRLLISKLSGLTHMIFRREYLLVDITAQEEGLADCLPLFDNMAAGLFKVPMTAQDREVRNAGLCPFRNEAFVTPGTVLYDAACGNFIDKGYKYHGSLQVMKNILSTEYLWNSLRVKGGAYGCMCGFAPSGEGYFVTYRDPHLGETFDIYKSVPDYFRSLQLDEKELTKYIIGAVGLADTPLTPYMSGMRSLAACLSGRSPENIQENRDQMLRTSLEDLHRLADTIAPVSGSDYICVIGNEAKIMEDSRRFSAIETLAGELKV